MHVAASNPQYFAAAQVPPRCIAKEREILTEQARKTEGKPPEIVAKMVEGRLRKSFREITLPGQPFVKDPDVSMEKLLKGAGAQVRRVPALRGRRRHREAPGGLRGGSHGSGQGVLQPGQSTEPRQQFTKKPRRKRGFFNHDEAFGDDRKR